MLTTRAQRLVDRPEGRLHLGGIAHVAGVALGAPTEPAGRCLGSRAVAGQHRHFGACTGERLRDGQADAARPAGHHGDLPAELDLHAASMNRVSSSAVPTLTTLAPGTMRLSCSASRRRASAAAVTGWAVALATTGNAGSANGAASSAARSAAAAGAIRGE